MHKNHNERRYMGHLHDAYSPQQYERIIQVKFLCRKTFLYTFKLFIHIILHNSCSVFEGGYSKYFSIFVCETKFCLSIPISQHVTAFMTVWHIPKTELAAAHLIVSECNRINHAIGNRTWISKEKRFQNQLKINHALIISGA